MGSTWGSRMAGNDYDKRWEQLAAAGQNPHGEADFVARLAPRRVLDAGCGTGRVAVELARRGCEAVGVDVDPEMIATARRKAPDMAWHERDLAGLDLGGQLFDVAVMAGNVLLFVSPGSEAAVVERVAAHLTPGGALVAGFQLRPGGYDLDRYDADCAAARLILSERYATWGLEAWRPGGDYAVSVHRRSKEAGRPA